MDLARLVVRTNDGRRDLKKDLLAAIQRDGRLVGLGQYSGQQASTMCDINQQRSGLSIGRMKLERLAHRPTCEVNQHVDGLMVNFP